MHFPLTEVSVIYVFVILDKGMSAELKCDSSSATRQHEIVECSGTLFQPVCLSCNLSKSATSVQWFMDHQQLTHDEFILKNIGDIDVNHCHPELYSLRLENPSTENHNASYSCVKDEENVSKFLLKLKAQSKLFINSTNIFNGKLLLSKEETINNLQCVIKGAVPPFDLAWSLNGVVVKQKTFTNTQEVEKYLSLDTNHSFRPNSITSNSQLTCSCRGKYISSDKITLHIFRIDFTENNSTSPAVASSTTADDASKNTLVKWSLVLAASFIALAVVTYVAIKGIQTFYVTRRETSVQLNLSTTANASADPIYEKYNYISETADQTCYITEIKEDIPEEQMQYNRNIPEVKKYVPVFELKYERNIPTQEKKYIPVVEMKYDRNISENSFQAES